MLLVGGVFVGLFFKMFGGLLLLLEIIRYLEIYYWYLLVIDLMVKDVGFGDYW